MNRVHYRAALRADTERIALLHADSWKRTYRGSYRDTFLDGDVVTNRLEAWSSRLAHDREDQFVYVAETDSELLGFVCVFGNEDRTWGSLIDNLHVFRECQRTGLGTSLMRAAGTWLTSRYPESGVYLWALEANERAHRFYERLGAVHAETAQLVVAGGGTPPTRRYVWPRPEVLTLRAAALTK
jgi:GNAT superfamily N-acetyltransferase